MQGFHVLVLKARSKWFAWTTVAVLALTVGVNTAIFLCVERLWLRRDGIPDPSRVVMILEHSGVASSERPFGRKTLDELRLTGAFEEVAGQVATHGPYARYLPAITLNGRALSAAAVTAEFFSVLGLEIQGRDFTTSDDVLGAELVAIVSQDLWQSLMRDREPGIGAHVDTLPEKIRVIGVAPEGFRGVRAGERIDLWVPAGVLPRLGRPGIVESNPLFVPFGRLQRGRTAGDVKNDTREQSDRIRLRFGGVAGGASLFDAVPIRELVASTEGTKFLQPNRLLATVVVAALMVLAAGWSTLWLLSTLHYSGRSREFLLRAACGATPSDIFRQLAKELGGLMTVGAVGAVLAAYLFLRVATAVIDAPVGTVTNVLLDVVLDVPAIAMSVLVALLVLSVSCGWSVYRTVTAAGLHSASRGEGPASSTGRRVLVAAHVLLCTVFVAGASTLGRLVWRDSSGWTGLIPEKAMFLRLHARPAFTGTHGDVANFDQEYASRARLLMGRLLELPGVESVGVGARPLGFVQAANFNSPMTVERDGVQVSFRAAMNTVGVGFLPALGLGLLAGSYPPDDPDIRPRPAIVTASFAEAVWGSDTAVDETFNVSGHAYHVYGVVQDHAIGSFQARSTRGLYAFDDVDGLVKGGVIDAVLRVRESVVSKAAVADTVQSVFPQAAAFDLVDGMELVREQLQGQLLGAFLFIGFGLTILVLSCVSLYSLVAQSVFEHSHEIAIRLALGAPRRAILRQLGSSLVLSMFAGFVAGGILSAIGSRYLGSIIHGLESDVGSYLIAMTSIGLIGVAGLLPAALRAQQSSFRLSS